MSEADSRVAILIIKYLEGSLTAEEEQALLEWQSERPDNKEFFEWVTSEEVIAQELKAYYKVDAARAWKKLAAEFNIKKQATIVVMGKWWQYAAAAVIVCLVIALSFLFFPVGTTEGTTKFGQDVQPGKDRAILQLGDGSLVLLDSVADGVIKEEGATQITKTVDGKIIYTNSGTAPAEKVLYNTIHVPRKGGTYTLALSDGTIVKLNSGTTLRYPTSFSGDIREVELNGEAYFEVAAQAPALSNSPGGGGLGKTPFIVVLNSMSGSRLGAVKVLGTRFNVMNFDDEKFVTTTLLEGKVKMLTVHADSAILQPGFQSQIDNSGTIKLSKADTQQAMAWVRGYLSMDGQSLDKVLREVARWYDIELEFKTKEFPIMGGEIKRDVPLSEVLKMLEDIGGGHFRIEGQKLIVLP